jgi:DNA-binding beta-propeller fold protein YncE
MAVNSSGESVPSNQASATTNLISYTYNVGKYPHGIAIDASGNVWVANEGSNNVTELSISGTTIGTYGVGSGPYGIAIDASGNVWVANHNTSIVTEIMGITAGPQYFPCLGVGCPVFQGGGNL